MASKNELGFDKFTNRDKSFMAFCDELRAYVEVRHHFPNKHTNLLSRVKYTRKKKTKGSWKYGNV